MSNTNTTSGENAKSKESLLFKQPETQIRPPKSTTKITPTSGENAKSKESLLFKQPETQIRPPKSSTKITPSSLSAPKSLSHITVKIKNSTEEVNVQTEAQNSDNTMSLPERKTTPVVNPNQSSSASQPKHETVTKPSTTQQEDRPSTSKPFAPAPSSDTKTNQKTMVIDVKPAPKIETPPENASAKPDGPKKPGEEKGDAALRTLATPPRPMIAKKWGAAIQKTLVEAEKEKPIKKKRRGSKEVEVDPFLAKFATVTTRRNTIKEVNEDGDDGEDYEEKCCDLSWCSWAFWKNYVIDPAEPFWFYWSLVASLATFYNLVVVFLRAVFTDFNNPDWYIYWFCFDYTSDFITILDMLVRCRLGFLEQGILVREKMRLVKMYVKSFRFPLDIISILPLDLVYLAVGVNTLLRLNRVLRIWRVNEFYSESETRTSFPNMFRMVFLIINICLMIHWNACIYFSMSKYLGFGYDDWGYDPTKPGYDSLPMTYLYCFYWSMLTLTAIGDVDPPQTLIATFYVVIVTLCGVLIFATIFGNVGAMINQMNASRQEFQQNVDSVKRYMDIRKVSPVLQDRVIQWFAYTWNNKQSVDDKQALNILPDKLKTEIAIQVHLDTLKRVAIFKDCEPGLLQELVLKLRLQVFSPEDYICKKGDIGKEMYIIKRGKLEVVSPDGKIVFVTLQDGAVFGEISILNIAGNKTGNRRTASVRSVGYSDLFCLSKDDLWDALKEYPDARAMLWEKGKQMLRKDNLLDEKAARLKELADMSLETKIDHINEMMEKMQKQLSDLTGNLHGVQKHMGIKGKPEEKAIEEAKK